MAEMILDLSDDIKRKYASFWIRLAGGIIDLIFLAFFFHIFSMVTGIQIWSIYSLAFLNNPLSAVVFVSVLWLYFAGLEASEYQATLGKMVFKTQVVNKDMQKVGFGKTSARFLFKVASISILLIGIILIAIQVDRQGLHDRLTGTFVIKN